MTASDITARRGKQLAGFAAAEVVQDGMLVGLGTGSTVAFAIAALARRCGEGLVIDTVATSQQTELIAHAAGLKIISFAAVARVDLGIDGVDEIDPQLRAIKGAGGALLREKIVASAADKMIAIADASKAVDALGRGAIPVEVLPFALAFVSAAIAALGATVRIRPGLRAGNWVTDQGNAILDCRFDAIADAPQLGAALSRIPGVLGHGLFVDEIDELYLSDGATVDVRIRPTSGEV